MTRPASADHWYPLFLTHGMMAALQLDGAKESALVMLETLENGGITAPVTTPTRTLMQLERMGLLCRETSASPPANPDEPGAYALTDAGRAWLDSRQGSQQVCDATRFRLELIDMAADEVRCPHLAVSAGLPPLCRAHFNAVQSREAAELVTSPASLQLWCLDGPDSWRRCLFWPGEPPGEGAPPPAPAGMPGVTPEKSSFDLTDLET